MKTQQAAWRFPVKSCHAGIPLGNAVTGLEIWGGGDKLKITIGRADFWDHRGGMNWTDKQNYRDIRDCLERGDEKGIHAIFASETEDVDGEPARPSIVSVGRIDISLPEGSILRSGSLELRNGLAAIEYEREGQAFLIEAQMDMESQLFHIAFPESGFRVENFPSWNHLSDYFKSVSMREPEILSKESGLRGWIQALPADPGICVGYLVDNESLWGTTALGSDGSELKQQTADYLLETRAHGSATLAESRERWWREYWNGVPDISIPNDSLDFTYAYGLHKFACFANPSGVPGTLQGPWIEDHEMPPWSSDYHFNINVQMCYWPALKANKPEYLRPLFDLVWSWRESLAANAKAFIGVDDGYMLPHAVDDHGTFMGGFWTGAVDHACTAWVAKMMHDYYLHTGDDDFLANIAYPFMKGAMRVYEAMMEEKDDVLSLPLTVSPEYRGARMDAWGADASFQLAAARQLAERVISAAKALGDDPDTKWMDILERLPEATFVGEDDDAKIALWNGQGLDESHRHHSLIAGICPFDTFDPHSEEWKLIVGNTINHWVALGMGQWSGWSMPWASMLHSRCGNGDMAELTLEIWRKVYVNEGHGTLHDVRFAGFSIMGRGSVCDTRKPRNVMQMDAGMGAVAAVSEMLLHERRGITYVFPGIPSTWLDAEFSRIPVSGGFLVSAKLANGDVESVTVESRRNETLRIANPFGESAARITYSNGESREFRDEILELKLMPGDGCEIVSI